MKKFIAGLMLCGLTALGGVAYANQETAYKPVEVHKLASVESENSKSVDNVINGFKDYMLEPVGENEHYIPFTTGGYPRCVGIALPFLIAGGVAMYFAWRYEKDSKP